MFCRVNINVPVGGRKQVERKKDRRTEIVSRCPLNPFNHLNVPSPSTSHTPSVRSRPPLARNLPSSLNASASTSSVCPWISSLAAFCFPLFFALFSTRNFGDDATHFPVPVERSHFRIDPSLPDVYSVRPSDERTADVTGRRCPRVRRHGGVEVLGRVEAMNKYTFPECWAYEKIGCWLLAT